MVHAGSLDKAGPPARRPSAAAITAGPLHVAEAPVPRDFRVRAKRPRAIGSPGGRHFGVGATHVACATCAGGDAARRVAQLAQRGLTDGGEKLSDDDGTHLRLRNDKPLATDGPYAEAHDVIGGIFTIKAESDAMAQARAATCPHLRGNQWIEIRRIENL